MPPSTPSDAARKKALRLSLTMSTPHRHRRFAILNDRAQRAAENNPAKVIAMEIGAAIPSVDDAEQADAIVQIVGK